MILNPGLMRHHIRGDAHQILHTTTDDNPCMNQPHQPVIRFQTKGQIFYGMHRPKSASKATRKVVNMVYIGQLDMTTMCLGCGKPCIREKLDEKPLKAFAQQPQLSEAGMIANKKE